MLCTGPAPSKQKSNTNSKYYSTHAHDSRTDVIRDIHNKVQDEECTRTKE